MLDEVEDKPPEQVPVRQFLKRRSGNPAGRGFGSRNKETRLPWSCCPTKPRR
jgi:hypothetical protein